MILLFFQRVKTGPRHCEENYAVIDEAISGVCYDFMRLPRSLWLLAMTIFYKFNNNFSGFSISCLIFTKNDTPSFPSIIR
ncbi:hypothetical protein FEC77_01380 [Rickettsia parkeri]|nr:hypothetical protein FEC77_01380 [Rickettsia parkeri]